MKAEHRSPRTDLASPDGIVQTMHSQLMHYGRKPSRAVAGRIVNCLDELLSHPQFRTRQEERCDLLRMRIYWKLVASQD